MVDEKSRSYTLLDILAQLTSTLPGGGISQAAVQVAKKAEAKVASANEKVVVLANIRLRLGFFCIHWISVAITDWGGI